MMQRLSKPYSVLMHILLVCVLAFISSLAMAADTQLTFFNAEIALGENDINAIQPQQWKKIALPDLWKLTHPNYDGPAWYKFEFDFDANPHLTHAVYLTRLAMNGEVYINGIKIGDGGNMSEPISRNWNRPQFFIIPPLLIKPKQNILLIKVVTPPYSQGMLYPPEIGQLQLLEPRYNQATFVRITLNQAAGLLIVGIGTLMLNLWWRRKKDVAYGLFGLAAFVWAAQSLNFYIINPPLPTSVWEIFVNSSFEAITALWLISLLNFLGIQARYFSIWLLSLMVISVVLRILAPSSYFMALNDSAHFLSIISVIIGLFYLTRAWLIHANKDAKLILATLCIILLFAIHDWMIHTKIKWLNAMLFGSQEYLMQFSAPALFLIVGLMMTSRYVRAINNFEQLNLELEQRVMAKHQELDQKFQQIQTMLKEQATLEERERIYQDLHDDLGAKLLTLVYRAQDSNNAELARAALQDLRDVVSRARSETLPFSELLADYRIECEKRLSDVHIQLYWQNEIDDSQLEFSQPQALNLGRILREAISNIIRHAQAQQVWVRLNTESSQLHITIEDNGIGLNLNHMPTHGRGLSNIKKRAQMLGGEVHFENSSRGGLKLKLTLNVSPHPTAP